MSKKIFHMKIKRIFCGALAVGMLLGQTSSVLAEAVSSPTPTPNPHTEIMHRLRIQILLRDGQPGPRLKRSQQFLWT